MAPFATVAELRDYLQNPDLTTNEAALALDIASGAIRDHVGWSITAETGVDLTLDSYGERRLFLPTMRLTAVTSVTEDGTELTVDDDFAWSQTGVLRRISAYWPRKERSVQVVFTHGWSIVPDSIKGVALSAAGRVVANPEGLRSYSLDGVTESFATPSGEVTLTLMKQEIAALGRYMLNRLG